MSTTLTYGRVLPATGDPGSTWFPALETNIALDDAHNHNGTNSVALTPVAFTKFSSSIASGDWSSAGGGNYTATVTVPAGISSASSPHNDVSYYNLTFIVATAATGLVVGDRIHPGFTRSSATQFVVTVNDSNLELTIRYT